MIFERSSIKCIFVIASVHSPTLLLCYNRFSLDTSCLFSVYTYRLGGVLHNAGLPLTVPQHWQRHKTKLGTKAHPAVKAYKADWLALAMNGQDERRIAHDLASFIINT